MSVKGFMINNEKLNECVNNLIYCFLIMKIIKIIENT